MKDLLIERLDNFLCSFIKLQLVDKNLHKKTREKVENLKLGQWQEHLDLCFH